MESQVDVILIGAQKAGTTTLAYLLEQHPTITLSDPKEPHFFSHNWNKGVSWYNSKFHSDVGIKVDASTSYSASDLESDSSKYALNHNNVATRAYSLNPEMKIIYIMRNPLERTYSGYWHYVRQGDEKRPFLEAIKDPSTNYLDISNYYDQINKWLHYYPIESFYFILFDDLKENPEKVAKDCYQFLGIDTNITIEKNFMKNKSYNVGWIGKKMNKFVNKYPNVINVKDKLPSFLVGNINNLRKGKGSIPKITNQEKNFLKDSFFEKNKKLELLTGLNLERWNK